MFFQILMTFLIKTYFVFLYFDRDLLPTKHQIFKNMRKICTLNGVNVFKLQKESMKSKEKCLIFQLLEKVLLSLEKIWWKIYWLQCWLCMSEKWSDLVFLMFISWLQSLASINQSLVNWQKDNHFYISQILVRK